MRAHTQTLPLGRTRASLSVFSFIGLTPACEADTHRLNLTSEEAQA